MKSSMKFKYIQLLFFISIFLFSCSNNKEKNVVDIHEIMPESKNYKEGNEQESIKQKEVYFIDSLDKYYLNLLDSFQVDLKSVQHLDIKTLPDRFSASISTKFYWTTQTDSINFMHWHFKDSNQTYNAFYNWLDGFGSKKRVIKIAEISKIQKRPFTILVRPKDIFFIESNKTLDEINWIKQLNYGVKTPYWKYIFTQNKANSKSTWVTMKDTIKTNIKL